MLAGGGGCARAPPSPGNQSLPSSVSTANNSSFSTACASTLRARAPGMVEAPGPAARRGEIEEHEAVKRGQLPAVEQRPEAPSGVCHEIGERHLAAKNES